LEEECGCQSKAEQANTSGTLLGGVSEFQTGPRDVLLSIRMMLPKSLVRSS
jgi:hypothetical protein